MQDISQLKKIVIESFEAKGILSEIRAQIRASVFKVVEEPDQDRDTVHFDWERADPLAIAHNDDKLLMALLVDDFCSRMDLQYTANVFGHESNLRLRADHDQVRNQLFEAVGLDPAADEPLIYQLLRQMNQPDSDTRNVGAEQKEPQELHQPRTGQQFGSHADAGPNADFNANANGNPLQPTEHALEEPIGVGVDGQDVRGLEIEPNSNHPRAVRMQQQDMVNNINLNELNQILQHGAQQHRPAHGQGQQENDDPHDEANQIYLSEPVALDITADSDLFKDFDHDESVDSFS